MWMQHLDAEVDMIGLFIAPSELHLKYKHKKPREVVLPMPLNNLTMTLIMVLLFGLVLRRVQDRSLILIVSINKKQNTKQPMLRMQTPPVLTLLKLKR
jgi:hypothetical protein